MQNSLEGILKNAVKFFNKLEKFAEDECTEYETQKRELQKDGKDIGSLLYAVIEIELRQAYALRNSAQYYKRRFSGKLAARSALREYARDVRLFKKLLDKNDKK